MADPKPAEKPSSVKFKTAPAEQKETSEKKKTGGILKGKEKSFLAPNLDFAATEAYKLLRTNLLFSFSDEKKCHVVGITSSLRGEGKTTTSINTSYMLAETGRHVLLIEADMRLPSASNKLGISRTPGLSNLLIGGTTFNEAIRKSGLNPNLYILPAGDIPPNPSELLGSETMKKVVEALAEKFEFIIIDLPPITAVSDALIVSKVTDGMVLVVSKDYATRSALASSMNQLKIADAKILGFVFTRGELPASGKYRKYKYGNYESYGK